MDKKKVNEAVLALWQTRDLVASAAWCNLGDDEWRDSPLRKQLCIALSAINGAFGFSEFGEQERAMREEEKCDQD